MDQTLALVSYLHEKEPFFKRMMKDGLKVTKFAKGEVDMEFTVQKNHLNAYGTLHGGMVASIIDWAGSIAIYSVDGGSTGVSTNITVSYNRSAQLGAVVK
jgi:acyl-coenzyme A thioesterase 13